MNVVHIQTEGMYCRRCPVRIQCALSRLSGVKYARADADRGLTSVAFDPRVVGARAIRDLIAASGFKARIVAENRRR